jgi:uncharacterized membrane protein YfcA
LFKKQALILTAIGLLTGFVTGLFGGGGGMILVPLLTTLPDMAEENIFPSSICIILPICVISIFLSQTQNPLSIFQLLPYLAGSFLGGVISGKCGNKIPVLWLHKALGILVLLGGIRYLWPSIH